MHAFPILPAQFRWTPEQIADAVPLRLSQVALFDAGRDTHASAAANAAASLARSRSASYLPAGAPAAPHFRIS